MIKKTYQIIVSILVCQAAGLIGSIFTFSAIPSWYSTLNKPSFNPPNWLFGPVWTVLYVLMGIALYLVWQQIRIDPRAKPAIILFLTHLILNASWSIIFFGLQNIGLALVELIVLWLMIILVTRQFWQIKKLAAKLILPYLAWVTFAAVLNLALFILN
ncbi:MAG: TspO/MBR family protein [Patescibacteria group bacterium]|jgi:tryptophan-rich sensory protein|nr:TspO/MBR family protein [Patescibacteria group bacterium]